MSDIPEALAEMERLNASFPYSSAIREWNKSGKKVIASVPMCPEEII
jgi:hypothetical protein